MHAPTNAYVMGAYHPDPSLNPPLGRLAPTQQNAETQIQRVHVKGKVGRPRNADRVLNLNPPPLKLAAE